MLTTFLKVVIDRFRYDYGSLRSLLVGVYDR